MNDGHRKQVAAQDRVTAVVDALLTGEPIRVQTASRLFEGRVWEIGRSPYDDSVRARVVDRGGRVHYFRVDKFDAQVEIS